MTVTVIANPKGGVGKSTLAVNVAGYLARRGHRVALGDLDPQESASLWLSVRPPEVPRIQTWPLQRGHFLPPPADTDRTVLDTPARMDEALFAELMQVADRVIVPLQASLFDISATRYFVLNMLQQRRFKRVDVAVVATRVRDHTYAAQELRRFLQGLGVPVLTELRDTQNYVQLAAHGLSIWDVPPGRVLRDQAQWVPIMDWLDATGRR
ncbi:MAG: ParA family protein [Burkholderiales bacterium]